MTALIDIVNDYKKKAYVCPVKYVFNNVESIELFNAFMTKIELETLLTIRKLEQCGSIPEYTIPSSKEYKEFAGLIIFELLNSRLYRPPKENYYELELEAGSIRWYMSHYFTKNEDSIYATKVSWLIKYILTFSKRIEKNNG